MEDDLNQDNSEVDVNYEELYNIVLERLECPMCMKYMFKPIKMCTVGHDICPRCQKHYGRCPICFESFTAIRNLSMETIASKIPIPCKNKYFGCTKKFMHPHQKLHEKTCEFQRVNCAIDSCTWSGLPKDIRLHYAAQAHCLFENGFVTLTLSVGYLGYMVRALDEAFWFKQRIFDNIIFWTVQFIGKEDMAANYIYTIEFADENGTKMVLFQDNCQSIFIKDDDLFNDKCCTVVDKLWLRNFCNCTNTLYCCVSISNNRES